jgi:hypothetical protein
MNYDKNKVVNYFCRHSAGPLAKVVNYCIGMTINFVSREVVLCALMFLPSKIPCACNQIIPTNLVTRLSRNVSSAVHYFHRHPVGLQMNVFNYFIGMTINSVSREIVISTPIICA